MSDNEESFAEAVYKEVAASGVECGLVDALIEMAPDYDTIADVIGYIAESGSPDLAASILRRFMQSTTNVGAGQNGSSGAGQNGTGASGGAAAQSTAEYTKAALILSRMIDSGNLTVAQDIVKFLLVSKDSGHGKMLDCYDLSLVVGTMVREGKDESAGRLLYALYSEDQGEESQAAQMLVPFLIGTLIDHNHADWAVEICKQLMYSTLEEIEDGAEPYDYSAMGWCLAQMVWFGHADWAARLCLELEKQRLDWYETACMMDSVTGWGDRTYSQTISNFMKDGQQQQRSAVAQPPAGPAAH